MMMLATAYGAHVVLLPRFDAEATLRAIKRHGITWMLLVPTMMLRMWRLPAEVRDACDMASLRVVWHMAAPCPGWLKEAFIALHLQGVTANLMSLDRKSTRLNSSH